MTAPEPGLFDVVATNGIYGRSVVVTMPEDRPQAVVRGPGPRRPTSGPQDAQAAAWWFREAEAIVLDLVATGRHVSVDDLHERYPDEPSATGAAYGKLFARLAKQGRLVEVGWQRSTRPEARGRRVVLWGAP